MGRFGAEVPAPFNGDLALARELVGEIRLADATDLVSRSDEMSGWTLTPAGTSAAPRSSELPRNVAEVSG